MGIGKHTGGLFDKHKPTRAVSTCRTPKPCGEVGSSRRWCHKTVRQSVWWKVRQTIQCQLISFAQSLAHLTRASTSLLLLPHAEVPFTACWRKWLCFQHMLVYSNHCLYQIFWITHYVRTIPQKMKIYVIFHSLLLSPLCPNFPEMLERWMER